VAVAVAVVARKGVSIAVNRVTFKENAQNLVQEVSRRKIVLHAEEEDTLLGSVQTNSLLTEKNS